MNDYSELPWKIEKGVINLSNTYLIHCAYGPIAIVQKSPSISIGDFDKNMETVQEALDCLDLCRRIWGDEWRDGLKRVLLDKGEIAPPDADPPDAASIKARWG